MDVDPGGLKHVDPVDPDPVPDPDPLHCQKLVFYVPERSFMYVTVFC